MTSKLPIPKGSRTYLQQTEGWMQPWELDFIYETATKISERLGPLLEVGSYKGLSTSALTLAGTTYCVDSWRNDPSTGRLVDYFPDFEKNLKKLGRWDRVVILRGDSRSIMPFIRDQSFRLVLVDANHDFEFVRSDLENGWRVLNSEGYLIVDDFQNPKTPDVFSAVADLELPVQPLPRTKLGYAVKD